ncbi:hypothetical protein [Parablautia muri]|uniref:hypothetical protein n=1 Tax=Parablautia muri TaxID=2320879 RepID=UPI00136B61D2|nr:hypothetical protein [Parablautia muri]
MERIGKIHDICGSYITYKADDVHIVSNYISPQLVSFEELEKVYHLYAGHMPQREDEIVMDRWVMETLGLRSEPGVKTRLSFNIADIDTREVRHIEKDFQIVDILGDIESLRAGNISMLFLEKAFWIVYQRKFSTM